MKNRRFFSQKLLPVLILPSLILVLFANISLADVTDLRARMGHQSYELSWNNDDATAVDQILYISTDNGNSFPFNSVSLGSSTRSWVVENVKKGVLYQFKINNKYSDCSESTGAVTTGYPLDGDTIGDTSNPGNPATKTTFNYPPCIPEGFLDYDQLNYHVYSQTMHGTDVRIAIHKDIDGLTTVGGDPVPTKDEFKTSVFDIFEEYWLVYGGFPFETYTVKVLSPNSTLQEDFISGDGMGFCTNEALGCNFYSSGPNMGYWQALTHEIHHAWLGNIIEPYEERCGVADELWFSEGATEYHAFRGMPYAASFYEFRINVTRGIYNSLVGTQYDLPLPDLANYVNNDGSDPDYGEMMQRKATLVCYLLDQQMINYGYSLDDLMRYLYINFGLQGIVFQTSDLLTAVNTITGQDFTNFFNDYVYGTTPLPLSTELNYLDHTPDSDFDGLLDSWEVEHFALLSYGPDDDPDGDGSTNSEEFSAGTNPATRDFPGVLYVDGENGLPCGDCSGGVSWATAFKTIERVLGCAIDGDEIWIKQGVYLVTAPIEIYKTVNLYGGFNGTETNRLERDWHTNVTTVNGQGTTRCFNIGTDATLDGLTITNGYSEFNGGGIYIEFSSPTIINSVISENNSDQVGGGIHNEAANPRIINCLFLANNAQFGGGMFNVGSSPLIINSTFSGNSAGNGGGIENIESSAPVITNSILWGNSAPSGPQIYDDITSIPVVSYSDIDQDGYDGVNGNIRLNPDFVGSGSYQLREGSACIDAGNNNAPNLAGTDLYGHPRIIDGDGDAIVVVDLGAYEFGDICKGDFDKDLDVDGSDLATLVSGANSLDLTTMAINFGMTNCPLY